MVSRKKAKGKARRAAKKNEVDAARDPAFLLKQVRLLQTKKECTHGWDPSEFPADHDCQKFIETAVKAFDPSEDNSGKVVNAAVRATKEKYPDVWRDSIASMEWLVAAFISIASEGIIRNKDSSYCAIVITFSEFLKQHLECKIYKSQPLLYMARVNELIAADERRLVSYLKKRIPCSCLDATYERVKSWPKMGMCCAAKCSLPDEGRVAASAMMSCEGCRHAHYCSEACQAASWEKHKDLCKLWKKWRANGKSKSAKDEKS